MFNHQFLERIRTREIRDVLDVLPATGAQVLEVGAGSGLQARFLAELGYVVEAVDVEASTYRDLQVFPVRDYDGRILPFADNSFDVVYSSNVLEHIQHQSKALSEMRRVLAPGGCMVHVVPSHAWRIWTTLTAFVAGPLRAYSVLCDRERRLVYRLVWALLYLGWPFAQRRHGEKGNAISESWHFRPAAWRNLFVNSGFRVDYEAPLGLFYTGNMLCGERLTMHRRQRLARRLGSACYVFRLSPE